MTTNNALDEIKQRMANLGYNADDIAVSQRSIALDHESAEIDTRDGEFYFLCDVSDYSAAWKIESEVCCVFFKRMDLCSRQPQRTHLHHAEPDRVSGKNLPELSCQCDNVCVLRRAGRTYRQRNRK